VHRSAAPSFLLVAVSQRSEFVAYGGLTNTSWVDGRAEVSFLADPSLAHGDEWYRTTFLTFLGWLDDLAFDELGLRRLVTETYVYRAFHISVLEEHGFRREGRLREHVIKQGAPVDSLLHGRLAKDR
jgi:RimJ/RimL family protein N-acetyltransferase